LTYSKEYLGLGIKFRIGLKIWEAVKESIDTYQKTGVPRIDNYDEREIVIDIRRAGNEGIVGLT